MNTYTQIFSALPKCEGALMEWEDSQEELIHFQQEQLTSEPSFLSNASEEEAIVIKGKVTISF